MTDRKPTVNDGNTCKRILQLFLEHNPAPATSIADTLGLPAADIRRHINTLVDEGLVETAPAPSIGPRGRGGPAKPYRLTDRDRAGFGYAYDGLASAALTALRRAGSEQAVAQFAYQRTDDILFDVTPVGQDVGKEEVVEVVVGAFRRAGHAATINQNTDGVQICQHRCPIGRVASEFPELCTAEYEAVSKLLGQHTRPLVTVADRNGVYTTNIPLTPVAETFTGSSQERSGE